MVLPACACLRLARLRASWLSLVNEKHSRTPTQTRGGGWGGACLFFSCLVSEGRSKRLGWATANGPHFNLKFSNKKALGQPPLGHLGPLRVTSCDPPPGGLEELLTGAFLVHNYFPSAFVLRNFFATNFNWAEAAGPLMARPGLIKVVSRS